jgi:Mg-chelatase subunit ChlD
MSRQRLTSTLLAATLVGLSGCAMPNLTRLPQVSPGGDGLISNHAEGLISNNAGGLDFEGGGKSATGGLAAGRTAAPAVAPAAGIVAESSLAADAPIPSHGGNLVADQQQLEALKAGSVDDNAKFTDYLAYLKAYKGEAMRPLDVSERHVIRVVDSAGKAVANADVTVALGTQVVFKGKSYANGELLFHPKAFEGAAQAEGYTVTATRGELSQSGTYARDQEGAWKLQLAAPVAKGPVKLDVLFLIDATGSMGGEIQRLQDTIKTVSSRIQGLDTQPGVRYGLVAYRDQNEEYVTASADFTANVADFKASLDKVEAAGGGDKPEDVESGLAKAVNGASWGQDAVRLVFLVADAAPHIDYPQATPYTTSVKKAAEKGIKLFPIGCSSLEPEGEFAFRQLAQFTMGQYLFITRGGDERTGGGGAASATVDKFQEGRLDDIVVDLVKAELDHLK